jgi:hypothetical protein
MTEDEKIARLAEGFNRLGDEQQRCVVGIGEALLYAQNVMRIRAPDIDADVDGSARNSG